MEDFMKKVISKAILKAIFLGAALTLVVGCSSWRKKAGTEGAPAAGNGIVSETTGGGSSEKVDASPMNYSATGSDAGNIDGLQSISFEYDKATLPDSEKAKLDGNVQWMNKNSKSKMQIEGHCDQRGSTEYNLSLGERRALAVKKMMTGKGISADRLSTVSYGKEKLLATGDSEADMARNRRANFVPSK